MDVPVIRHGPQGRRVGMSLPVLPQAPCRFRGYEHRAGRAMRGRWEGADRPASRAPRGPSELMKVRVAFGVVEILGVRHVRPLRPALALGTDHFAAGARLRLRGARPCRDGDEFPWPRRSPRWPSPSTPPVESDQGGLRWLRNAVVRRCGFRQCRSLPGAMYFASKRSARPDHRARAPVSVLERGVSRGMGVGSAGLVPTRPGRVGGVQIGSRRLHRRSQTARVSPCLSGGENPGSEASTFGGTGRPR